MTLPLRFYSASTPNRQYEFYSIPCAKKGNAHDQRTCRKRSVPGPGSRQGCSLLRTPRTDPDEPDSSIRLLPWVFDGEALIGLPYAAQRVGHATPDLPPVRALLIRVSLGSAPLAPPPVARHCSSASRLLWRSHGRASSASAPRLPDADQSSARYEPAGRPWDLPVSIQGAFAHLSPQAIG
jgi:hypothetical protein